MKLIKVFIALVVISGLALSASFVWYSKSLEQVLPISEPFVYEVERGSSTSAVIQDLQALNILEPPLQLVAKLHVRHQSLGTRLKAGEFRLEPGLTIQSLFALLSSTKHVRYKVTFVEGSTFAEARLAIESVPEIKNTLEGVSDQEVLNRLKEIHIKTDTEESLALNFSHPEGSIYPDTYFFLKGETDLSILSRAHARLRAVLLDEWRKKQSKLPIMSPYEALILASIVEKETGQPSEREEIAGVFIRRLNKGMRLQTDPTVIYGLGSRYNGNITRKHLRDYTPYNTYRINGLPPTPIALAGREAIYAALNPKPGKTLYFVARGDGSHAFSETIHQHNKAVREFQLRRKSDYRSAPKRSN